MINFQTELRPALLSVLGCKDYREFRETLIEADRILTVSGIEDRLIAKRIASFGEDFSPLKIQRHCKMLRMALRYSILLGITQLSYRALALRVADSQLFQWFTHTGLIDEVRPVSKSSIERFDKLFSSEEITGLIHDLNQAVMAQAGAEKLLYRETALRFDEIFADTTCVKANIHFPVDWVLIRDATRTLILAIELIREQGLRHRISKPKKFETQMNKLCIAMTHTRKKRDAKKARKHIFRRMKALSKTIKMHAENYHELLAKNWQKTEWSELESRVVLNRIQQILDQLPQAIKQAHERIIGERRIANSAKILSLYEPDIHVLVRGKANAEVEFGNGLYLAEQVDGLIVDWEFMKDQPPADCKLVEPSLKRIQDYYGLPQSYATDRGFDAASNTVVLEELSVMNAICPKSPQKLRERLEEDAFCHLQTRRGNTEARIAIFKNAYLGQPLRSKGFQNRATRIEWCILSHNLWKLATMAAQKRREGGVAQAA